MPPPPISRGKRVLKTSDSEVFEPITGKIDDSQLAFCAWDSSDPNGNGIVGGLQKDSSTVTHVD